MLRLLVCSTLLVFVASPALADAEEDAIAACAKTLKRDGIAIGVSADFNASGSGERFDVSVKADYAGRSGVRITCKTNKGRVTHIDYG